MTCPAVVTTRIPPEPLPPEGVDLNALQRGIMQALPEEAALAWLQWQQATYPAWARMLAERLDGAQRACEAARASNPQ